MTHDEEGRVCQSPQCGRPFWVSIRGRFPSRDREAITCPYCGFSWEERTTGVFIERAMTEVEEAAFRAARGN